MFFLWVNVAIYYGLSHFLLTPRWNKKVAFLGFLAMSIPTIYMKTQLLLPTNYMGAMTFLGLIAFSRIFYTDSFDRLFFVCIAFYLSAICANYIMVIPVFLFMDPEVLANASWHSLQSLLMIMAIDAVGFLLDAGFIFLWRRYLERFSKSILFVVFFLIQIFLVFIQPVISGEMLGYYRDYEEGGTILPMLVMLLDLVFIMEFWISERRGSLKIRMMETAYLSEVEQNYYSSLRSFQSEREILKRTLFEKTDQLGKSLSAGKWERAKEDVSDLKEEIQKTKQKRFCEHPVVNAVLTEKNELCREEGILLDAELELSANLSIKDIHLCNLFSNLLDNALRALRKVPVKERRIRIHSGMDGQFFYIVMENPSLTEKTAPRAHHGYGMRILEDIAENYNGKLEHEYRDGIFTTRIFLYPSAGSEPKGGREV